jgi:hypothetical protein
VDVPIFGPEWASAKAAYRQFEFRRQVDFTVRHEVGRVVSRTGSALTGTKTYRHDIYVVRITNKSPKRGLVVRRVWFETTPATEVTAKEFKIEPDESWTKDVPVSSVPGDPPAVLRLGRCALGPDDKVAESHPAKPTA